MRIKIQGQSDDIIFVDGDIREEFYVNCDETSYLATSNGVLVRIEYTNGGLWRVELIKGDGCKHERHIATDADSDDYSDVLELEGDFEWVICGNAKFGN